MRAFSLAPRLRSWITPSSNGSIIIHVHDSLGKGLRRFLRQIMPDAALDSPVRIFAGEFLSVRTRVRMRRAIGITFKGDGGHGDHRKFGKRFSRSSYFASPSASPRRQR